MKSVGEAWVELSDVWYNTMSHRVDNLYNAWEEADKAVKKVDSQRDIGPLSLPVQMSELEELNEKRRRIVSFCNGIHYEISEKIDNPFSVAMSEQAEGTYSLNPKDIKVSTGKFLGWTTSTSLKDLVSSTITNKELKKDFQNKCKNLDKDKISGNLKNSIKEAKFWEIEFRKSEECKKIVYEVFTEDVRANWKTMTEAERKKIIEDYVNKIGKVLYGKNKTTVKYDTSSGFGYSIDGLWRYISIHPKFVSDPKGNYSIDKVIDTLTHETRHQYQYRVKSNPGKYRISDNLKKQWKEKYIESDPKKNNFFDYYNQEVERDARAFAALSRPK